MAKKHRTPIPLSGKMITLKKNLQDQLAQSKSLGEQIHAGTTTASTITTGVSHVFNVIDSFLSAYRQIPLVGGILQLVATLAKSISIVSDPEKPIAEKIVSSILIAAIIALSITAITLGGLAAAIIGTIIASTVTIMEGLGFFGKIAEKFQLANSYKIKKEFIDLVAKRTEPDNDKYNDLFEIRAIELQHELEKSYPNKMEQQLKEELNFINAVLRKKNIIPGNNKESDAYKLNQLYTKRAEQLKTLVDKIALINSIIKSAEQKELLNEIKSLQKEITKTDDSIEEIIAPLAKIERDNLKSTINLPLSYSTFAIAAASTLISIAGLLVVAGVIAAPPIMVPVMFAVGSVMAVIGLIKWTAEKMAETEDAQLKAEETAKHQDAVLDEALSVYEQQLNLDLASHSNPARQVKSLLTVHDKKPALSPTESTVSSLDSRFTLFGSSSREQIKVTEQKAAEITNEKAPTTFDSIPKPTR
ncbi:TPA: T4SS effector SidA [Legionella pneumophila]|nr:T4SS effector SidA [Legionella pneumophila]MDW9166506.1 T4SS effector SidA [Legionella pneumophila subsp. fraseri]MDX1846616.1 T4SS effector SidA [Legionella pneumophila subsp. fraseri]HAT1772465.1 T4SS effector SidA [Legionella pneumophila]HAT1847351.1 T4SS effector SidA [Legionella pneumophila]HAT1862426.1 T4SS effector SidA [Legionella pneumophila]